MGRYYYFHIVEDGNDIVPLSDDALGNLYSYDEESYAMGQIRGTAKIYARRHDATIAVYTKLGRLVWTERPRVINEWQRWHVDYIARHIRGISIEVIRDIEEYNDEGLENTAKAYSTREKSPPFDPPTRPSVE